MTKQNFLYNICESLGKNNKPTYVVMSIAAVKGICRPIFTMMDKTEEPETKKYTAIREGLTEIIAIPTYFACGEISAKLSAKLPEALQTRGKKNLMFLGVCVAAVFVIPALCSLAIKPLMDKIQNKNSSKQSLDINTLSEMNVLQSTQANNPTKKLKHLSTFSSRPQLGMKVGGL